jgi:hypothetical protein
MIKWFAANELFLNLDKTNIINFTAKNSAHSTLRIDYKEKYVEETLNRNLLITDINNINWKNHIEQCIDIFQLDTQKFSAN